MGRIKQTVGRVTGNDRLQRAGERDQLRGEAEGAVADRKDAVAAANEQLNQRVKHPRK